MGVLSLTVKEYVSACRRRIVTVIFYHHLNTYCFYIYEKKKKKKLFYEGCNWKKIEDLHSKENLPSGQFPSFLGKSIIPGNQCGKTAATRALGDVE